MYKIKKTRFYCEGLSRYYYSINGKLYSDKECKKEAKGVIPKLSEAEKSFGRVGAGGEEMFEGDIIHDTHYVGRGKRNHYYRVIIKDGKFCMVNIVSGKIVNLENFPFTSEVIVGNINENPELLE